MTPGFLSVERQHRCKTHHETTGEIIMNQVNIIGNIGAEPKVTSFQSGKRKATFSVALNSYSKDKENRPAPTWVHCEMWGKRQ